MQQLKTDMTIRKFEERDYAGVVAVGNAIFPDRPGTVEELQYDDEHYDKKCVNERYVAEDRSSGTTLGYAGLWHSAWAFHPRKFGMEIRVHPDHQRNGIGTALWLRLQEVLRDHQAIDVKTYTWEKMPSGIAFATRLGFHEVMRAWESRLEVGTFDFTRFTPHVDQQSLQAQDRRLAQSGLNRRTPAIPGTPPRHGVEGEDGRVCPRPRHPRDPDV